MKRILLFLVLVGFYVISSAQTNVAEYRIANASTVFGVNIPIGTKIYNIATGEYWVCITGTASTATLTTGAANFASLVVKDEATFSAANFNGKTTFAVSKDDFYDYVSIGDTDADGLINKVDLSSAGLVKTDASGVISVATAGTDYIATEVDGSITNEAQSLTAGGTTSPTITLSAANGAGGGTVTFAGAGGVTLGQAGGTITITGPAADGDGSAVNEGVLGVSAGSATTAVITSNTSGATGVTISAGSGISISETTSSNGGTITLSSSSGTPSTEAFEEDDATPNAFALAHTAIVANGARVSLNGATLKPSQYTLASGTITIASSVPVAQYDQVVITYTY